jgi:carbon-monoxide dehydrogenase medium subunit
MPAVPFDYVAPATVEEAVEALGRYGDRAKVLAGGQSLIPLLTLRLARPDVVVDLNGIEELGRVIHRDHEIAVGSLVRHRALERGEGALAACPLLAEAAALIGNVRVRTLGTIGGSLAHADPAAELPAVVCALDATIVVRGPAGEREVAARDFFVGALTTALRPDEIVVAVRVPVPAPRTGAAILELSRRAGDFAIVAAAALVRLGAGGEIASARVALAGAGPTPARLFAVEEALAGRQPEAAAFRDAARGLGREIAPESDAHASAAYRTHLARVLTVRALERAAGAARGART